MYTELTEQPDMPKWWQFIQRAHYRKWSAEMQQKRSEKDTQIAFIAAVAEALRNTQISANATLHHTYAERPPAPRPSRMTVVYVMQHGQEIREYVQLNGQSYTTLSPMHYVWNQELPPSHIRYEFGYSDGSPW